MQKIYQFSDEAKAICIVKILYEKGVINAETYRAVREKYDTEVFSHEDDNEREF